MLTDLARPVLTGWGAMALVMAALWFAQRRLRNAGIVDIAWSLGTGLLAAYFAATSPGYGPRRLIIAIIAALWGARLGLHLIARVFGEKEEDGRYKALRRRWGGRAEIYLFVFFQLQAFWAVLFALPMLVAAGNTRPALGPLDAAAVVVWVASVAGEALADRQLARFRARPGSRGAVCREGLWRYSRHPNYFFEWTHWWAYVLLGIGAPHGWLALLGPVAMLWFLLRVTGIPPTEARAIESRGDAYREYQRTTSAFFPWPPRAQTQEPRQGSIQEPPRTSSTPRTPTKTSNAPTTTPPKARPAA